MRKRRNSARSTIARVTMTFIVILICSLMLMGGFVYWSTVGLMDRQTSALIETDIEGLAEVYQRGGLRGLVGTIESRIERDPKRSSIYLVTDHARVPVVGNISAWPEVAPDQAGWIEFGLTDSAAGNRTRARSRPFLLRGGVNLLVGRDIRNLLETRNLVRRSLLWGMGLATLTGIAAGLFFSRRVGRRLETINRTSREVMQGNLERRVPILGNGDDLDELAGSLNAMLDEIQQLLIGIEHVSDNIAHDLRTPLSRLRNRLVELGGSIGDDEQAAAAVECCVAEVDELLATFNALLRIAKLEAAGPRKNLAVVEIDEVVRAALELYGPVAEERGILIQSRLAAVTVRGERELLLQALCNILDNAIKFSPRGGRIDIDLQSDNVGVKLSVSDQGIGLAGADRARIFDRFYRGERARSTDGSGLGLSLVQAICKYHGAAISLRDTKPGLSVVIELPRGPGSSIPPA